MLLLLIALLLHPVHETISEVEWNPVTRRLEVALRLDVMDAQWLGKRVSRAERVEPAEPAEAGKPSSRTKPRALATSSKPAIQAVEPEAKDQVERSKDPWQLRYLRSRFRLDPQPTTPGQSAKQDGDLYHWIGTDENKGHQWWFFEVEPVDGKRPLLIENRILFEKESNQANRVFILSPKPVRSLILTPQQPKTTLFSAEQDDQSN